MDLSTFSRRLTTQGSTLMRRDPTDHKAKWRETDLRWYKKSSPRFRNQKNRTLVIMTLIRANERKLAIGITADRQLSQ